MKHTINDALQILKPLVKEGRLAILVGSGISKPSNLPDWYGFLKEFVDFCETIQSLLPPEYRFTDLINESKKMIDKEPTRVASVLKKQLKMIQDKNTTNVYDRYIRWLRRTFSNAQPNQYHRLIVKTNYSYILTTNYDELLETAAEQEGYGIALNSLNFNEASRFASALYEKRASIIHVHGNLNSVAFDEFIFTAEDYVNIRRDHPGFTVALQSLFTTHSILFVGYGGSDPHLESFIEDLAYHFSWPDRGGLPTCFLVLPNTEVNLVTETYKHGLRTDIIPILNYGQVTKLLKELQKVAPR